MWFQHMLIATRIPQRDSPASVSFRFSPFLCVCVHVLCHNGTWVLHKMCSVVFFCYFFALWQTELVSPAFRAFHAVTLHPAIWIIYSCYCYCVLFVGFCSLWFFYFSLEASQEQEGRGGEGEMKAAAAKRKCSQSFSCGFSHCALWAN